MRGASRPKKAMILILMLMLPIIDQVFSASLKADGEKDKGQPEMAQPLDNHPMEWTVGKDGESSAAVTADTYRYFLMKRMDDLLAEAMDMLARVKDSHSRRWLETFIYKMAELAVQFRGKHSQRRAEFSTAPSQVLPTPQPIDAAITVEKPEQSHVSDYQVTPTQLTNVLPVNEAVSERQVVTRSGFADDVLIEDELVRQLHEQARISREEHLKKMEKRIDTTTTATTTDSELYQSIKTKIRKLHVEGDEKHLLMALAREVNELSDLVEEEYSPKENRNSGHLTDGQLPQQKRKMKGNQEPHDNIAPLGQTVIHSRNAAIPQRLNHRDASIQRDESMLSQRVKPEDVEQNSGNAKKKSQFPPQNINRVFVGPIDQTTQSPSNLTPRRNFMYDIDADRLAENRQFNQKVKVQKMNQFRDHSLKDISSRSGDNQNKARHPVLERIMLSQHGHNAPGLYSHSKNVMDVYDSPTDVKIHKVNVSEPSAPAHAYEHIQSDTDDLKMKPAIYKKPNPGFKSAKGNYQNQQWDSTHGGEPGNTEDFHFDHVSIPDQLESNSQNEPQTEPHPRAGKILMVSDKLVKAKFNHNEMKNNATKPKEKYGNVTQNIYVYGNGYPN